MKNMKFCPRCGSKNINWIFPQMWSTYECKDCGNITSFIVEDGNMADEVRKEYLKNQKKINNYKEG